MASTQLKACLPAEANALGELRRRINELLASAGVAESSRHEALLVAHELAANAIEHGSGARDEIEVQCSLVGKQLRLAVLDNSRSPSVPVAHKPEAEQARGRGLYLVDWLTDSWTETLVRGRRQGHRNAHPSARAEGRPARLVRMGELVLTHETRPSPAMR